MVVVRKAQRRSPRLQASIAASAGAEAGDHESDRLSSGDDSKQSEPDSDTIHVRRPKDAAGKQLQREGTEPALGPTIERTPERMAEMQDPEPMREPSALKSALHVPPSGTVTADLNMEQHDQGQDAGTGNDSTISRVQTPEPVLQARGRDKRPCSPSAETISRSSSPPTYIGGVEGKPIIIESTGRTSPHQFAKRQKITTTSYNLVTPNGAVISSTQVPSHGGGHRERQQRVSTQHSPTPMGDRSARLADTVTQRLPPITEYPLKTLDEGQRQNIPTPYVVDDSVERSRNHTFSLAGSSGLSNVDSGASVPIPPLLPDYDRSDQIFAITNRAQQLTRLSLRYHATPTHDRRRLRKEIDALSSLYRDEIVKWVKDEADYERQILKNRASIAVGPPINSYSVPRNPALKTSTASSSSKAAIGVGANPPPAVPMIPPSGIHPHPHHIHQQQQHPSHLPPTSNHRSLRPLRPRGPLPESSANYLINFPTEVYEAIQQGVQKQAREQAQNLHIPSQSIQSQQLFHAASQNFYHQLHQHAQAAALEAQKQQQIQIDVAYYAQQRHAHAATALHALQQRNPAPSGPEQAQRAETRRVDDSGDWERKRKADEEIRFYMSGESAFWTGGNAMDRSEEGPGDGKGKGPA